MYRASDIDLDLSYFDCHETASCFSCSLPAVCGKSSEEWIITFCHIFKGHAVQMV